MNIHCVKSDITDVDSCQLADGRVGEEHGMVTMAIGNGAGR